MIVCLLLCTMLSAMAASAQKSDRQQRVSREQLADIQARHIIKELALDDKTSEKFLETYRSFQSEIWALGPRVRAKKGRASDAETEQMMKQRFDRSEKILKIRRKYYDEYSKFLTQAQIQRVYELERQMMKRFVAKKKTYKKMDRKK